MRKQELIKFENNIMYICSNLNKALSIYNQFANIQVPVILNLIVDQLIDMIIQVNVRDVYIGKRSMSRLT